jgi:arylsulfatase
MEKKMNSKQNILMTSAVLLSCGAALAAEPAAQRPNIILILADDLGYSDISPYGGEVRTPNLERLAENGIRFRNFYNTARCCPSRASLLTGLYPHQAGIGHMTSEEVEQDYDYGYPEYQGCLNRNGLTLGEALREAGYRTLVAGKWHVGTFRGMWPRDRGFDRFYGLIRGASNFYQPEPDKMLTLDDTPVKLPVPDDYYTTDAFTDQAIGFVDEAVKKHAGQPFFLYLAYTSPHWPLQAPEKYVEHYRKYYEQGWDTLRPLRLKQVIASGVVPAGCGPSAVVAPAWDSLPEPKRREMAHRMALYAGMVEAMDENIGRLLAKLEQLGVRDNTLIVFLSDNGGCAEGGMLGGGKARQLGTKEGYFLTLGEAWANYCNTPLEKYKHYTTEGGIRTPFIVSWPKGIKARGQWTDQVGCIMDFMPTFLDLAKHDYPSTYAGNTLVPLSGKSLVPALTGGAPEPREIFFEHEGNKAVIDGEWKLVATYDQSWRLHHLPDDPSELKDLSKVEPERFKAMCVAWADWANRTGVRQWPVTRKSDYQPPHRDYPVKLN